MDSLKSLMDKKNYELVVKLTDNSLDHLSLFYRMSALLALGRIDDALNVVKVHRNILLKKPSLLIKFHIEILCLLGRFDEAYEALNEYKELPYDSQETEEILSMMSRYIREEEKKTYQKREMSEDEIREKLFSSNDDEVLFALGQVSNRKLEPFLLPILKILRSYPKQSVRSFALLLLVNFNYDKEVDFLHIDKIIKVVPNKLNKPFLVAGFSSVKDMSFAFTSMYHDPSLEQTAMHILSSYLIYIYPETIELDKNEIIVAFAYLGYKMLNYETFDLANECQKYGLDYNKLLAFSEKVSEAMKVF